MRPFPSKKRIALHRAEDFFAQIRIALLKLSDQLLDLLAAAAAVSGTVAFHNRERQPCSRRTRLAFADVEQRADLRDDAGENLLAQSGY